MRRAAEETGVKSPGFCTACFDGNYPVRPDGDTEAYSNQKTLFSEYAVEESH
ncbi:MAG: hypothetical protein N2Z22_09645 [Turneriella sp.]|nr:hypothetical protein [Turneriella sp.]